MLKQLDTICYAICIICIVAGLILFLVIIWGEWDSELLGKAFKTIGAVFLASALTLATNRAIQRTSGPGA